MRREDPAASEDMDRSAARSVALIHERSIQQSRVLITRRMVRVARSAHGRVVAIPEPIC